MVVLSPEEFGALFAEDRGPAEGLAFVHGGQDTANLSGQANARMSPERMEDAFRREGWL